MKKLYRYFILGFFTLTLGVLSGCQGLNADKVVSYNDAIVSFYGRYTTQTDKSYESIFKETEPRNIIIILNKLKKDAASYQKSSKVIPVPEPAKKLAAALDHIFEIERKGYDDLIIAFEKAKDDEQQADNLDSVIAQFQKAHDEGVDNFVKVQKELAEEFDLEIEK